MVIPIHDDNPVRRTPWVTYGLIAANLLIFILVEPINHLPTVSGATVAQVCHQERFFDQWAAIPRELLHNHPLPPHVYDIAGVAHCPAYFPHKSVVLSVLVAMFLHGGWIHILGNMLFLYIFGNNVEDRLGSLRYLVFYLVAGYVATYGFAAADPNSTETLIGASGAIAGVLGAYLVLYPRARVRTLIPIAFFFVWPRLPAWVVLGFWFVLQYWYAAGSSVASGASVAYLAHVIRFVLGVVVGLAIRNNSAPARR